MEKKIFSEIVSKLQNLFLVFKDAFFFISLPWFSASCARVFYNPVILLTSPATNSTVLQRRQESGVGQGLLLLRRI